MDHMDVRTCRECGEAYYIDQESRHYAKDHPVQQPPEWVKRMQEGRSPARDKTGWLVR